MTSKHTDIAPIHLYGIPNCDTVRKARAWLTEHDIEVVFHDLKKSPPAAADIASWLKFVPLELLINKKGTTWRALTPEQKTAAADPVTALALISSQPTLIKRPLLDISDKAASQHVSVGFSAAQFAGIFGTPS